MGRVPPVWSGRVGQWPWSVRAALSFFLPLRCPCLLAALGPLVLGPPAPPLGAGPWALVPNPASHLGLRCSAALVAVLFAPVPFRSSPALPGASRSQVRWSPYPPGMLPRYPGAASLPAPPAIAGSNGGIFDVYRAWASTPFPLSTPCMLYLHRDVGRAERVSKFLHRS